MESVWWAGRIIGPPTTASWYRWAVSRPRLGDRVTPIRSAVCAALVALAALGLTALPSSAADGRNYDVADGRYFEHDSSDGRGFVVLDDEAAPLWGEFRRLGGIRVLGYPISRRYECDGAVCQAFQRAVFKWSPGAKEAELLNVLDWLHFQGQDDWLDEQWGIPPWSPDREHPEKKLSEKGRKKEEAEALALLEANDALESAYTRRGPAASNVYGLPRAYRATETGAVLRTQRAALIQSSEAPDEVDLVPAGAILREAGLIPAEALAPVDAPEPRDATPPTRIQVPELGIDAEVVALDMDGDGQLPTPSSARVVAWYSYGAPLGEGGNAVLAGHVDWNRERGVFWNLREAQPGQTITLSGSAGRVYEYTVEWARDYSAESLEGLRELRPRRGPTTLTLVTCSGRFDVATRTYEDRRVVRATLVGQRG
jgi:Sortase domain